MKGFLKKHKNIVVYITTLVLSVGFIVGGYFCFRAEPDENPYSGDVYTAKVTEIVNVNDQSYSLGGDSDVALREIVFNAEITSLDTLLTGIEVQVLQTIDGMMPVNPREVRVGDSVIINHIDLGDGEGLSWIFNEYHRSGSLLILFVAFAIMILLFGRTKGANTLISLMFTILAVFLVFIPAILSGFNIYLITVIIAIFMIFMTLILVNGLSKKTLCAIGGNLGGLALAGLLSYLLTVILSLTGAVDEQSIYLLTLNPNTPLDLNAIVFAGIVIGALGATMDVAMTIASAMNELAENMDNRSFSTMLRSGFNIGKDAMSTMTNTLILAYVGSSLSVVLLLFGNESSILSALNREMIVTEIIRAIVGSMGILLAIPITSLLAAFIYNRRSGVSDIVK